MTNRFWATSGDVTEDSVDSSIGNASNSSRDSSQQEWYQESEDGGISASRAVVTRSNPVNPGLANAEPHVRANLFYLSLVEGRCSTQALEAINAGRSTDLKVTEDDPEVQTLSRRMFYEVKRELHKAGMLSAEYVDQDLPHLNQYLSQFDNILDKIATQQTHSLPYGISSPITAITIPRSSEITTSLFAASTSRALVPSSLFNMAQDTPIDFHAQYHALLRLMFPDEKDFSKALPTFQYEGNFDQLHRLGKGGFGTVYKCRHKIDRQIYAIKKVIVSQRMMQRLYDSYNVDKLRQLVQEVQTLASCRHLNIVYYNYCFFEPKPGDASVEDTLDGNDDVRSTQRNTNEGNDKTGKNVEGDEIPLGSGLSLGFNNMVTYDYEPDLRRDVAVQRRRAASQTSAIIAGGLDDGVCFIEDESPQPEEASESQTNIRRASSPGTRSGYFRRGDDDSDTEEMPLARRSKSPHPYVNFHFCMYIVMSPYPLSLFDYINQTSDSETSDSETSDSETSDSLPSKPSKKQVIKLPEKKPDIKHCYHVFPTVKILIAILDGVEYIHRKNIVHRDLKPANVLLEIKEKGEKPPPGFINISDCKECKVEQEKSLMEQMKQLKLKVEQDKAEEKDDGPENKDPEEEKEDCWISPKICDFGLVHDLSAVPVDPSTPPSPVLSTVSDNQQTKKKKKGKKSTKESMALGTPTYLPPNQRKSTEVCPKLDVYALGIMAFEMLCKFDTATGRAMAIRDLKEKGEVPSEFKENVMKACILGMVQREREHRWDCSSVRKYLEVVLEAGS